ncbi:response regulator receiver domain-containing protein [Palleronia aestuarii]|uniref:Response regulator receiver domain-containing protein n=1 Tax=Palleronia aestuarii TaxID=568105 RepID=A0A2W7NFM6_9RHOB|nr:response regulator [Palleronia aestuarii]PZX16977.1 response regulator receiver domain-containing protein [Palleronia aestuarii]
MKILHVEDEADIREIAELALKFDPDFEVTSVANGADALERAAEIDPELLLLDVMMPDMDGPSLLKTLRGHARTAGTPVIFMTAAAQKHIVDDLMQLGAIGVITKPFDPMTLAEDVREIVESRGIVAAG